MDKIDIGLDPAKVIASLHEMSAATMKLAEDIDQALGKDAPKSIDTLADKAEKGTGQIQTFFRNLGKRVKEDLKTAFDATGVLAGAKFAKDIGEGVKSVFDMERAFDKLNTRLQLTGKAYANFKKDLGSKVAATGSKLEDVLPGVESASSRGGVKSASQLAGIGEALGKSKQITGEGTEGLSDTVIEILKSQGKKVTEDSFKQTLDALQGTRVAGSFKSASEAGHAIEGLSPYAKQMGLGTRELGGLAATAGKSGAAGQDILKQLMEQASTPGGMAKLNSVLGQQIFKNGKLDAGAIGKVNTGRFGQYSQQVLESATGLHGASGADLARFVEAFKNNMDSFQTVVQGSNETSKQFEVATDNLASKVDKFKQRLMETGREVGDGFSSAANSLMKGDVKGAAAAAGGALGSAWENKGDVAAGLGITAGVGILAGGGLKGLLGKAGGGVLGSLAGGAVADAAGIQKVFVVNMGDGIGGGLGGVTGAAGKLAKFGGLATAGAYGGAALAGVGLGYGVVKGADAITGGGYSKVVGKPGEWLANMMYGGDEDIAMARAGGGKSGNAAETTAALAKAIEQGLSKAKLKVEQPMSNPSKVTNTGVSH